MLNKVYFLFDQKIKIKKNLVENNKKASTINSIVAGEDVQNEPNIDQKFVSK